MRKQWTDYELGFIQDHADWSGKQIAEELGRTQNSVSKKRALIRSGWAPQLEAWRSHEDDFLLANPRMKASDVAAHIGRTTEAVRTRRRFLVRDADINQRFGGNISPTSIGSRPLLAKSCPSCGRLLQAKWFSAKKRGWGKNCTRCVGKSRGKQLDTNSPRHQKQSRENKRRYQELTVSGASQNGQPWVEADFEILRNPDMTILQKALALHRTYCGTRDACYRNGFTSQVGLGDPERDQWMIDNPNTARVEEITSYLTADPKEPVWDWDDSDLAVSA